MPIVIDVGNYDGVKVIIFFAIVNCQIEKHQVN